MMTTLAAVVPFVVGPIAAVGPIAVIPIAAVAVAAVGPIAVIPIAAVAAVAAVVPIAANSHSHRRVAVAAAVAVAAIRVVWIAITGSPGKGIVVTPRTPIIKRIAVWIGLVMTIIEVSIVVIVRIDPVIPLRVGKRNGRQQRQKCEHVSHVSFPF